MNENKIYVKLHGGIGNQFYQYCFAKYLESVYVNHQIILDTEFYREIEKQRYPRENVFTYLSNFYTIHFDDIGEFRLNIISRIAKKMAKRDKKYKIINIFNLFFGNYIIENSWYINNLKLLKFRKIGDLYFYGYWQDYKFIKYGIEDLKIKLEQKFPCYIIDKFKVAIHIRRGDYLKISHDGKNSIVLGIDYYKAAFDYYNNFGFYKFEVFSDDLAWCMINLPKLFPNFIFSYDSKKLNDLECLYFMSKHANIIAANSTYSLWAFYLSEIEKISIPSNWLNSYTNVGVNLVNSDYFGSLYGVSFLKNN
jgi:hypothetical protein